MVFPLVGMQGFAAASDNPANMRSSASSSAPTWCRTRSRRTARVSTGARIVGPAVVALIIAAAGTDLRFGLNAVSYLATIVALLAIRIRDLRPRAAVARAKGQIRDGLRYAMGVPELRAALLTMAVVGTFSMNFTVVRSGRRRRGRTIPLSRVDGLPEVPARHVRSLRARQHRADRRLARQPANRRAITGRVFNVRGGRISVAEGWRAGPRRQPDRDHRRDPAELRRRDPRGCVADAQPQRRTSPVSPSAPREQCDDQRCASTFDDRPDRGAARLARRQLGPRPVRRRVVGTAGAVGMGGAACCRSTATAAASTAATRCASRERSPSSARSRRRWAWGSASSRRRSPRTGRVSRSSGTSPMQ